MSKKFDMRICGCGRIHMVPIEKVDNALKENKNLLLICGGCGKATIIGADIELDWFNEDSDGLIYNMYSYKFSDRSISAENFEDHRDSKPLSEIFYSHGVRVPMMTGMHAGRYANGKFSDEWYPDFSKIERKDITVEEITKYLSLEEMADIVLRDCERILGNPDEYDSLAADLYCTARVLKRYIAKEMDDPNDPAVQLYKSEKAHFYHLMEEL